MFLYVFSEGMFLYFIILNLVFIFIGWCVFYEEFIVDWFNDIFIWEIYLNGYVIFFWILKENGF